MKKTLVLLLILTFSVSWTAASDLSFFGGFHTTEAITLGVAGTIFSFEPDNFGVFGVRYEQSFAKILGIENSLAVTTDSLTLPDNQSENGLYYTGNLVVNAPFSKVVPNATVGIGFFHQFGDATPDLGSTFLINYGGGLKFRELAGPVGLRIDFRRFYYTDVLNEGVSTNEISGGVVLTF